MTDEQDPNLGWGTPEERWAAEAAGSIEDMTIRVRYRKVRWFKDLVPPPREDGRPWPEAIWCAWIEGSKSGWSEESAADAVRMALASREADRLWKAQGPAKLRSLDELIAHVGGRDSLDAKQLATLEERWNKNDANWFQRVDEAAP